uniref:alpha-amylase n=1 Tax=Branchiostoma floridae TaxID=7739 RepID=C3ZA03_BRAFL|eukprot:XP_002594580.1 hypothetical protein BRAFLDRAFT_77551 [Branchiostoma floridae]
MQLGHIFRKQYGQKLVYLDSFGEGWGMLSDNNALVFVDNHDNQRGHGGGGKSILTFRDSRLYKMANAFMLAFPYGFVRMMSSYYWDQWWEGGKDKNDWIGPPADRSGNTMGVSINNKGNCRNGWICEHRWRSNRNMVRFRNVAAGHGMFNWWDNGNNQIAFSRGDRAFIAINNEDRSALNATLQTGLSSGDYCDVISGDLSNGFCTGKTITVGWDGRAHIYIAVDDEDPIIAIHVGSKVCRGNGIDQGVIDPVDLVHPNPVSPTGTERTVVFINKQTLVGQDLFLRGGIGHEGRPGCTRDAVSSQCAIPISHRIGGTNTNLNSWKQGDNHLDWYGVECGQVSPPNENRVIAIPYRPWWERYQPISYHLNTRSGNDEDFRDMVHRCNQQGVRIYADVVINHMCGFGGSGHGTGGSYFNAENLDFPAVPYGSNDFNNCSTCGTSDCKVQSYDDVNQVSPPNENRVIAIPYRPWWERYQPISYHLNTRSGNDEDFRDMVHRCNQQGVRVCVSLKPPATFGSCPKLLTTFLLHFNPSLRPKELRAQGSPLVWTTNNPNNAATVNSQGYGYTPLNQWGDHYWMLDVDMDCSRTEYGWFEVKAMTIVRYPGGGVQWESDRNQGTCGGTAGGTKPYSSGNHFARCGKINAFDFDGNACTINEF